MNKMAKGALATGVGVALLLGGGGTLAIWNQTQAANAGQIAAGDLALNVTEAGVWTNAYGTVVDLDPSNTVADYKVVPGDVLTYRQVMDVQLAGDLMEAKLTVDKLPTGDYVSKNVTIDDIVVTDATGTEIQNATLRPSNSGKVVASAKFIFWGDTEGRDSAKALADFSQITYKLDQQALPATTPAPTAK